MKVRNDDYAEYHSQTLVWDDNGDKRFDNGSRMYSNTIVTNDWLLVTRSKNTLSLVTSN